MKMDFHPMGIGFPRIYGDELSWTYFGELPKKRTFNRRSGLSTEGIEILQGANGKFFGTSKSFFRTFISFFRTFISALLGEFSFAP